MFTRFESTDEEKFSLVEISNSLNELASSGFYQVKVDNETFRIFEVSKEKFELKKVDCDLITICEHTHFYELNKIQKLNMNIKFANVCISSQIMELFATIG